MRNTGKLYLPISGHAWQLQWFSRFAIDSAKFITSRVYFSDFKGLVSFKQTQMFRNDSFGDFNVPEPNEVCLFFWGLISLTSPGVQLSYHISYILPYPTTSGPLKALIDLQKNAHPWRVCQGLWVASDSGAAEDRRSTCNMGDSSWRQTALANQSCIPVLLTNPNI